MPLWIYKRSGSLILQSLTIDDIRQVVKEEIAAAMSLTVESTSNDESATKLPDADQEVKTAEAAPAEEKPAAKDKAK